MNNGAMHLLLACFCILVQIPILILLTALAWESFGS